MLSLHMFFGRSDETDEDLFTREEIERGRRYHRPLYIAAAIDLALVLGVLAGLAVWERPGKAVEGLPWWVATLVAAALVALALAAVRLPLGFWRGFVRERRWGLSTQSARSWLADRAKAFAVGAVLTAGMLLGLAALVRLFPAGWPLAAAVAGTALVLALAFLGPVVLEPLFNRFEPLRREPLATDLRALAERAGTPVRDVLVADASRRTTKANAYVSGLGRSRRLVLFDTLLARAGPGEVAVIVAHELAHRRERHPAKATLLGMAGAALAVAVLWLVLGDDAGDAGSVPLVLLVLTGLELAALPLFAALSRRWERTADRIALRLTGDRAALEAAFRRLAETNVADLDPPRLLQLLAATHPTLPERIVAARQADL